MSLFEKNYLKDIQKDRSNWSIQKIYRWYVKLPEYYKVAWINHYCTIGQIRELHEKYDLIFGIDDRGNFMEVENEELAKRRGIEVLEWSN